MPKPGQTLYSFLWELGYFKVIDVVFFTFWVSAVVALARCVSQAQWALMVGIGVVWIALWMTWITILVFRCMYFVLQVRSDMKLLPADAARIVARFQQQAGA